MNAKLKTFFARYNYFLRLMLTICTALLLSVFTITYVLVQRSYNEINNQNTDYYIEHTYHFSNYYSEQINRMLTAVYVIRRQIENERIKNRVWDRIEWENVQRVECPWQPYMICFMILTMCHIKLFLFCWNYIEMISDGDEDRPKALQIY